MKRYDAGHTTVKEGSLLRKASTSDAIRVIDEEKRLIDFTISNERVDRYGDIITLAGWDLKEYRKNPVVLFGHDSRSPPIGRAIKVSRDADALRATAQFMSAELSPFADSIFQMYKGKFLRATSVGFMPIKWEPITDEEGGFNGYKFTKQELLEFSCVPIPANPDALMDAKSIGIDIKGVVGWVEETIASWKGLGPMLKDVYGINKEELEAMSRKVNPAGVPGFRVDPAVQDALLAKNLAAAKKQKADAPDIIPETAFIKLGEKELEFPVIDDVEVGTMLLTQLLAEDGKKDIMIDAAPKVIKISVGFLNQVLANPDANPDGSVSLIFEGKPEKPTAGVKFKALNMDVVYRFTGTTDGTETLVAEQFLLVAKEPKVVIPEAPAVPAAAPVVAEKVTEVVEKVVAPAKPEVVERTTTGVTEISDTPVTKSLPDMLTNLEAVLLDFETALDANTNLRSSGDRHTKRKVEFLAGFLREVADKMAPPKALAETPRATTPAPAAPVVTGGEKEFISIEQAETVLIERLAPKLTEIIGKQINRVRGRLE